jgi:tRNA threonylcarbamoyladenosine biosynthesis protein TsaB
MLVLGIESSSPVASVALVDKKKVWGELTLNTGLTHSEQLLPLIERLLKITKVKRTDIGGIAIAGGPGSFTGLRIGMATAKGLAQGWDVPLASVSTLLVMAFPWCGTFGLVSPLLEARRNEVYAALYRFSGINYQEEIKAEAVVPEIWAEKLVVYQEPIIFSGTGALKYQALWQEKLQEKFILPPSCLQINRAVCVAWLGIEKLLAGRADDLFTLKPFYIRSSEAERKLAVRESRENN